MTQYGISVSKNGKSVDSKDILDFILKNNLPNLKAFKQGTASVNVTGAGDFTVDISHGLGYFPKFIHLISVDPNNPTQKTLGRFYALGAFGSLGVDSYVTKDILHLGWRDSSASPGHFRTYPYTVTFYYYIFYDPLQ